MPKIVSQCQKWVFSYIYTLRGTIVYAYTLPNAFAYLNTCILHLNTCTTYLNTLTRLLTPYLNTCTTNFNVLSRLPIETCTAYLIYDTTRQPIRTLVSQSESSITPSRQLIKVEYYVTRVVNQSKSSITSPESTQLIGRPFSAPGSSQLVIAYLNA